MSDEIVSGVDAEPHLIPVETVPHEDVHDTQFACKQFK